MVRIARVERSETRGALTGGSPRLRFGLRFGSRNRVAPVTQSPAWASRPAPGRPRDPNSRISRSLPMAPAAPAPAPALAHALRDVSLDDKYALDTGRVFLTGTQALVRLLMLQRQRDVAAGLNTAGFVSGYRGSPLGALDQALWQAQQLPRPRAHPLPAGRQRGPRRDRRSGARSRSTSTRARSTTACSRCGTARARASTAAATCSSTPTTPAPRSTAACWCWPATTTAPSPRRCRTRPTTCSRRR